MDKASNYINNGIQILEYFFATLVLLAVIVSAISSVGIFLKLDWSSNTVFYDFVYRILLLVIGLELARLLITHNLQAVLELIAFAIARKTLKPDVTSLDILLIVTSFFLLICSRIFISINFQELIKNRYRKVVK
jgi:hypothetical protein